MHFLEVFMAPKTFASGGAPRTGPFSKSPHLLSTSGFGGLASQEYQICLLPCIVYAVRYNKERKRKPTVQEKVARL